MKHVNHHQVTQLWHEQNHVCPLCGGWLFPGDQKNPWHIDHIVSIKKGGKHERPNLQITHGKCNLKKGAA